MNRARLILLLTSLVCQSEETGRTWADLIRTGEQHLRAGRHREALKHLFDAQKAYRGSASSSLELAGKARMHHLIAEAYFEQAMPAKALDHASRALKLYRSAGDLYQTHYLVCLGSVALAQQKLGNFAGATLRFLETVDLLSRWRGPISDTAMDVWSQAAWFFYTLGNADQSEKLFKEMIRQAELLGDPATISLPLHGLAAVYADWGRYLEAEPLIRRSLELAPRLPLIKVMDIAARRIILAQALAGQRKLAEAEVEFTAAIPVLRQHNNPSYAILGTCLHHFAMLRAEQKRFDEAIELMAEADAILTRWYVSSDPTILGHRREYIHVLRAAGRKHEAKALKKRLDADQQTWKAQNPATHTVDARAFR